MGFERIYDYSDVPTIKRFSESNKFFRLLMGPFGCIAPGTKIITERGLQPIADLTRPMRVLSWNEKMCQFGLSQASISFPKGKDYLYRVITKQGEFVAAGHHRVLCADGKYRRVDEIHPGHFLVQDLNDRSLKLILEYQRLCYIDDHRFRQTTLSSLDRYGLLFHQCDQQLRREEETFQVFVQELNDVQRLILFSCLCEDGHMGDLLERLLKHTHPDQSCDHTQIGGCQHPVLLPREVLVDHTDLQSFLHIEEISRAIMQLLLMLFFHHIKQISSSYFRSYSPSSLSNGAIIAIEKQNVKQEFWDIQVEDTNNYVTEDGTIHHNSGKSSGCVTEIISRGMEQQPSYDGVRRIKCAVVRNTYVQLIDTTQATFFYWLPPDLFGSYNKTEHRYIINKIPMEDGTKVEIEVIFRALDKPEHVRNLLSMELTLAWFNEIREISKFIVDHMEGRVRRYPKDVPITWAGVIADTNPPDQSSWIYKFYEEIVPKDEKNEGLAERYEIFKQPSGRSENAENLTHLDGGVKYYTDLAIGKDPEFVKVYCDGEYGYTRDGKPVYGNYMDSIHCATENIEAIKGYPIIAAYDFGLTPSCILVQYLHSGKLNVLKEFYEENTGLRSFLKEVIKPYLASRYRGFEIVTTGDMAGMKRNDSDEFNCFIELKQQGFSATPSTTNSLLARINAVDSFLTKMVEGKPAFQLSPCCELLRRGFIGEYKLHMFKGVNERLSEIPLKNSFSHIHDALQYAALLADRGGVTGARGISGSRYDAPVVKGPSRTMYAWT